METLPQNSYQYLNLNSFDYKYTLSQTTFDLSNAISDLCPVEEQRNLKKKDKSVISTSTVADKKKKKQNKNNKKKVKELVAKWYKTLIEPYVNGQKLSNILINYACSAFRYAEGELTIWKM